VAKVRFLGDRPLFVAELDQLVQPDEIYPVPDARFEAYMLHPERWESIEEPPATEQAPPKKTAAKKAAAKQSTTAAAAATEQAATAAAASTPAGAES
jgi:hypothetical protein